MSIPCEQRGRQIYFWRTYSCFRDSFKYLTYIITLIGKIPRKLYLQMRKLSMETFSNLPKFAYLQMVESRLKTRFIWKKTLLFHCLLYINNLYSSSIFLFTYSLHVQSLPISSLPLFFHSLLSLRKCNPKTLAAWILTNPSTSTDNGGLYNNTGCLMNWDRGGWVCYLPRNSCHISAVAPRDPWVPHFFSLIS